MNNEIIDYIKNARQHGLSDEQIKLSLVNAGWAEQEVDHLLNPLIAPPPGPAQAHVGTTHQPEADYHVTMWVVFQYILMFIGLAVSAIALAGISHHFIDEKLGMPSRYSYGYGYFGSDMLLGYVASLIVGFPIFAILLIVLRKKLETNPEVRNIKARKFFIYIALLWTFIVLIIRLVSLVYSFLSGDEYASASIAHLLVTLLTSGSIFLYFVLDVRKGMK